MFMVLCPLVRLNSASAELRVKLTEDSVGRAADRGLFCATRGQLGKMNAFG